jgi:hypothetical protein
MTRGAVSTEVLARLAAATAELQEWIDNAGVRVEDTDTDAEVRRWLDGAGPPLEWVSTAVTADEWFFITTLYGTMTLDGQRTHIRKFFPQFIREAGRDIRNFTPALVAGWKLRQPWMKTRLCRMADVLKDRGQTMSQYAERLRELEAQATPAVPMPGLDAILADHRAGEGKTLSVFVRDCIKGNCFSIDSRVKAQLTRFQLPVDERQLVAACLALDMNPRKIARVFYQSENGG